MAKSHHLLSIAAFLIAAPYGVAQSKEVSVTITEPAVFKLSTLYSFADEVALVRVLAGTTEAYDITVYKGQVVTAFKGSSVGEVIYFGPYVRTELGGEYLLFLKNEKDPLRPKENASGYGTIKYSLVFDQGYSSMLSSYECVFDGKSSNCDYGIRICTDYIELPASLRTSPPAGTDTPFGCRWVRRDKFLSVLTDFDNPFAIH